jgi:hypothetical protein
MPRRQRSARTDLLIALLSTLGAAISAYDMIGTTVRTVHVLTIFAGGLAAGISIGSARARMRAERATQGVVSE